MTATTTAATGAPPSFLRRHRVKLVLLAVVAAALAITALWTFIALAFTYSSGDRVGYVQKFSHRGWICRTWEGELAMTPVPGAAPQMFAFTVRDPAVVRQIQAAEGKKVSLHYAQHRGTVSSCFGDTQYFIEGVTVLSP